MTTYFTPNNVAAHTLIRATQFNALQQAIADAFDLLPAPETFKDGKLLSAVATGTVDAIVLTPVAGVLPAYDGSEVFGFFSTGANTGPVSVNISGLGAVALKRFDGADMAAGDIAAAQFVMIGHNGTNFRMIGIHGTDKAASAASAAAAAVSAASALTSQGTASAAATSATASATTASTAATNASNSATAAAGSATTASTQATNAAASATAAATSATNAANSATAAATSATNASNSATAAAGSATTASTQATNASASATAAAASAAQAAASATAVGATVSQWAVGAGTANAITATFPTTVTVLTDGMILGFRAASTNTSKNPTFKADGTTARTITQIGGGELAGGSIMPNGEYFVRYNLANTRWDLLNPSVQFIAEGTVASAGTVDLTTSGASRQILTGSVTVTGFTGPNMRVRLRCTGNPQFTYNATTLITPTGANMQFAAGDIIDIETDGSSNARIVGYVLTGGVKESNVTGVAVTGGTVAAITSLILGPGKWRLFGLVQEDGTGAGANVYSAVGIGTANNAFTGCIQGKSRVYFTNYITGTSPLGSGSVCFDVTLTAASTTYYLLAYCLTNSDFFDGYIRAERIA